MAYIKEPEGVDFLVDPTPISDSERKRISEIIAYYKATGRKQGVKKSASKATKSNRLESSLKH